MEILRLTGCSLRGIAAKRFSRRLLPYWLVAVTVGGLLFSPVIAGATTLISQAYTVAGTLSPGSIVSLDKNSTDKVSAAITNNANNILGVIIDNGNSQLSIGSDQSNQVQVATSGEEQVLVSDLDGSITVGDPITASPISGVGMKATSNAKIIGLAQDSFPNSTAKQQTYKDQSGKQQSVSLGQVPVVVNVTYFYKQPDKTIIPTALQNLANALANKKVNTLPILISIGIFIVTLVVVVSIIYSLIHSSIISVGRNPMAQAAVYRNVIQLTVLVIIILMVGVGSIYMILTKL